MTGSTATVHRHGNGHLVQRNALEQHFHVLQRADGHAGLAYITNHTFIVRVITAVRGEVESDRKAFLAGSQVTTVECIGLLCRREPCILADGPRTESVHHRIRATQIGRQTGSILQMLHALEVFFCINRLYFNMFRRLPISMDAVSLLPLGTVDGLESGIDI